MVFFEYAITWVEALLISWPIFSALSEHQAKAHIHMHFCKFTICKSSTNSVFHITEFWGFFCWLLCIITLLLCITTLYYLTMKQLTTLTVKLIFLFQTFFKKNFNSSAAWSWEMSEMCVKMFSKQRDLQRNATTGVNYFLLNTSTNNLNPRVSLRNQLSSYF